MNQSKTKLTNRKFYNKWLYKISLEFDGGAIFKDRSVDQVKDFCYGIDPGYRPYSIFYKAHQHKQEILNICIFLEQFDSNSWAKRIEGNLVDFYTNDIEFYNRFSINFSELIKNRFEPSAKMAEVLNDHEFAIVGKKLPHNRYNYRVYLSPHKMDHDVEEKTKYLDWLETQHPKIRCSSKVRDWFIKTRWNWDRRYVLVEDDATLLMLKLRNSDVVGRVYKYIISDK